MTREDYIRKLMDIQDVCTQAQKGNAPESPESLAGIILSIIRA